jgi:hypothetical protein
LNEGRRHTYNLRTDIPRGGQDAFRFCAPSGDRSLLLGRFAEYETEKNVETSDGEEEEGSDEGEVVYVVREDGGSDSAAFWVNYGWHF